MMAKLAFYSIHVLSSRQLTPDHSGEHLMTNCYACRLEHGRLWHKVGYGTRRETGSHIFSTTGEDHH